MKIRRVLGIAVILLATAVGGEGEAGETRGGGADPAVTESLVDLGAIAPRIRIEMRYARPGNFLGRILYDSCQCFLEHDVAVRLARVQAFLEEQGLGLKVWDCYRPRAVQRAMWALLPDPRYVADPEQGSRHNRGAAVDVTLVDAQGRELPMGTDHDDFSPRAHIDAAGLPAEARTNRGWLAAAMAREGFVVLPTEWWHFDAPGWASHPLRDVPLSSLPGARSTTGPCDP